MASIYLEWDAAPGFQPPPPYGADNYRCYVWYRGQRKPSLDFTENGTHHTLANVAGGEYSFRVKGMFEAEVSQAYATESIVIVGTQVDPEGGDPPPDGNPDIAAPGSLLLQEL